MELLRVTNAGLKMSDGTTIPVIRAVVGGTLGGVSQADANSFMREVYNRAVGVISAVSYYTNDTNAFIPEYTTDGSVTFGDDTGFKFIRNVTKRSNWETIGIDGLFYKGTRIANVPVSSGYSAYACGYLVILTDEDYNLIYTTLNYINGIDIRYTANPGATAANNTVVCVLGSDGTLVDRQPSWSLRTGENIKDDIPNEIDPENNDPYAPGGETEPGGGEGDFDDNTEPIEFSEDPSLSAVDTGFITLFNPSLAQLNDLANYMWGSLFDLENWKKLFANPMDAILGLSIVPVSVPNGGTSNVKVGNIDTGVAMTKAAAQYVNVDCGTLNVKEFWGAYLDYSPYTKAEIFLPFIGTHPLDIDDIMKKAVHVKYKVDILSGACVAQIKCGNAVLYSFSGQCAATIPVTGRDWTNVVGSALSIVGNVAGAAITGGMTAPTAAVNVAQAVTNVIKPNIQKSGNVAGMAGIMGIQKPYLILTRPHQAVPKNQNKYTGYPSFITTKLSKCSGYTEVEIIHLEGVPGTTEELAEIERLLQSGVIF